MNSANTKSALIVILILTALLWLFAIPQGSIIGGVLAGLILLVTIAAYWTVK